MGEYWSGGGDKLAGEYVLEGGEMSKYSVFYREGEICLRVPVGDSFCNHVITDATAHRLQNELGRQAWRSRL